MKMVEEVEVVEVDAESKFPDPASIPIFKGLEEDYAHNTPCNREETAVMPIEETWSNGFQVLAMGNLYFGNALIKMCSLATMLSEKERELAAKDSFLELEKKRNDYLELEMLSLKTSHQAELKNCIKIYKEPAEWLVDANKFVVDNGGKPFLANGVML
ncbi:hypothetical protein Scep_019772 [Stephania cephalantha]|uniref:Uncharacterized protein n=1 Tax=Stephania cephalantha TaxID=152367 RepID=A0AAP0NMH0_9MAGN